VFNYSYTDNEGEMKSFLETIKENITISARGSRFLLTEEV
jgi:hypothetical protein